MSHSRLPESVPFYVTRQIRFGIKEDFRNAVRDAEKRFIRYELQSSPGGHDGHISSTFLLIVTSPIQVALPVYNKLHLRDNTSSFCM